MEVSRVGEDLMVEAYTRPPAAPEGEV